MRVVRKIYKVTQSPLHYKVLDPITCPLLVSTHSTYIIIMGWFDNDHKHTQAHNQVSMSFEMWYCVALIATGSSTIAPPSTSLTSVMS
jgi:hypothetical protein